MEINNNRELKIFEAIAEGDLQHQEVDIIIQLLVELREYRESVLSPDDIIRMQNSNKDLMRYHINRRWNIEEEPDNIIKICRGEHEDNEPCKWKRYRLIMDDNS